MSKSAYYGDRMFRRKLPKSWNNKKAIDDRKMGDSNERYVSAFLEESEVINMIR